MTKRACLGYLHLDIFNTYIYFFWACNQSNEGRLDCADRGDWGSGDVTSALDV